MKLSVFTVPLYDRSTEEAFAYLSQRGVQMVEIGTGGFPGTGHCNPTELLASPAKLQQFKDLLEKYHLEISAFSCHSNHVHPDAAIRQQAAADFATTLKLAEKMDIHTVVTFSGCPGDQEGARYSNWVTCAWPEDFQKILAYQWDDVLIPFWKEAAAQAADYGVDKIALEMHPGFCVYNPATLLRLRSAVGEAIGANFDPSHLYWQGMDPVAAIRSLKGAIYHFHAKDTNINKQNTAENGVLDTGNLGDISNRSWLFRTVGYGHDAGQWKDTLSALRINGYDGAISIEHEDALMSVEEGLDKAIHFLHDVIIKDNPGQLWWT